MAKTLIKLEDGILVEVEDNTNRIENINGGSAQKVASNIGIIEPLLKKVIAPIKNTFNEMNKEMNMEKAEVELGFAFEGKGDLFLVSGTAKANLTVKITLLPKK